MFRLSRRVTLKVASVLAALIVALAVAQPAWAGAATVNLTGPNTLSCTPGNIVSANGSVKLSVAGDYYFRMHIDNPARGTTSALAGINVFAGVPVTVPGAFNGMVPPATQPGDTLVFILIVYDDLALTQVEGTGFIAYNCSTGEIVAWPPGGCADGRLNGNCSAPAAVYCAGNSYDIYSINASGEGTLAFSFDAGDYIAETGDPVLVGSGNGVDVWYLPESGQFQVHAYQTDGKLYTLLWTSCGGGADAEFSEYED